MGYEEGISPFLEDFIEGTSEEGPAAALNACLSEAVAGTPEVSNEAVLRAIRLLAAVCIHHEGLTEAAASIGVHLGGGDGSRATGAARGVLRVLRSLYAHVHKAVVKCVTVQCDAEQQRRTEAQN